MGGGGEALDVTSPHDGPATHVNKVTSLYLRSQLHSTPLHFTSFISLTHSIHFLSSTLFNHSTPLLPPLPPHSVYHSIPSFHFSQSTQFRLSSPLLPPESTSLPLHSLHLQLVSSNSIPYSIVHHFPSISSTSTTPHIHPSLHPH